MKRLKVNDNSLPDHITNLPHNIVSSILSRLPTKDAVRTSVLSRNWKRNWTSIYNIFMDDQIKSVGLKNGAVKFNRILTRLLLHTQNSKLKNFRLSCDRLSHNPDDFETWTSNVLMRNVEKIMIQAPNIRGLDSPSCFSGWTLLRELNIMLSCTLKVPINNCFPNLKRLHLSRGKHGDVKIMTTNISDTGRTVLIFPVLKVLRLSNCDWLDVTSVEIQAPELIMFGSHSSYGVRNYEIKIWGPKLEIYQSSGGFIDHSFLNAPVAVTYASLENFLMNETSASRAHKILKEFHNLRRFKISGKSLKHFLRFKPGLVYPTFPRLKELEANFFCASKDVLELLKVLPPLESLIVNTRLFGEYEFGEALTPKIVSQLKEVKLFNFMETKGQYDFAMCLLEKSEFLKKMTVYLWENAFDNKNLAVLGGKPIDIVEVVGESLSKLKPKGSSCELVVELNDTEYI